MIDCFRRLLPRLRSFAVRTGSRKDGAAGFFLELLLLVVALAAYYAVRLLVRGSGIEPLENSIGLLRLETVLHLDWEASLQAPFLDHLGLVHLFNFIYAWGYWLILAGSLAYLFIRRRDDYRALRNAIMLSGFIGFFVFASFPVAPPRLADVGIVDTVQLSSSVLEEVARPSALTNVNAAMPSFHFGWILLCSVCLARTFKRRLNRGLMIAVPVLMGLTIIVTGNHYVLDAIVGGVLCLLALVPWTMQRRSPEQEPYELQNV